MFASGVVQSIDVSLDGNFSSAIIPIQQQGNGRVADVDEGDGNVAAGSALGGGKDERLRFSESLERVPLSGVNREAREIHFYRGHGQRERTQHGTVEQIRSCPLPQAGQLEGEADFWRARGQLFRRKISESGLLLALDKCTGLLDPELPGELPIQQRERFPGCEFRRPQFIVGRHRQGRIIAEENGVGMINGLEERNRLPSIRRAVTLAAHLQTEHQIQMRQPRFAHALPGQHGRMDWPHNGEKLTTIPITARPGTQARGIEWADFTFRCARAARRRVGRALPACERVAWRRV